MPRIVFHAPYVYTPTLERRISIVYKASPTPRLVNSDCAAKAIAAGVAHLAQAEAVRRPTKTKAARGR